MSGPQFQEAQNENKGTIGWIKENRTKSIVLLVALVVLAGGLYLFSKQKTNSTASVVGGTSQETQSPTANNQVSPAPTNSNPKTVVNPPKEEITNSEFKERAQKGEGITHLARRAAKSYIDANADLKGKISKEQKIYIEDYLKIKIKEGLGKKGLQPNDEISFDKDLVKKAVEASQKLTKKQLDNLTKYTLSVPSL